MDNKTPILTELAERAARAYGQSIESWVRAAYVLLEAREIANHGEWLNLLEHAGIPDRTAQNMLRMAKAGLKYETVSDLGGIRATRDFLTVADRARKNWRVALAACEAGSREYHEVVQAFPDGPLSGVCWLDSEDDRQVVIDAWQCLSSNDEPE